MEIEIVEFYPKKKKMETEEISGTLHVFLVDIKADLRGIPIQKVAGQWIVKPPLIVLKYPKIEDGKKITGYPIFTFVDDKENEEFFDSIKKKAVPYIEENFLRK